MSGGASPASGASPRSSSGVRLPRAIASLPMSTEPAPSLADLGGWPFVLGRLVGGENLGSAEVSAALSEILAGAATSAQIAAFAVSLRM